MHVINEKEENGEGDKALSILFESAKRARVQVTGVLQTGDIVSQIIKMAGTELAAIIIMGASKATNMIPWVSSYTRKRSNVPVLVIPNETSPE